MLYKNFKVFIWIWPITMVTVYSVTMVMLHTYHFPYVDPVLLIHKSTQFIKNFNNYLYLAPNNTLPRTFLLNHGDVNIHIWYSISSWNWYYLDEWKCSNMAMCDHFHTTHAVDADQFRLGSTNPKKNIQALDVLWCASYAS